MNYLTTRRLLRNLGTPGAIQSDPVAARLRDAMRTASPADAVRQTAEEALRPFGPGHWAIVCRADVEGESLMTLSRELYLSIRTLCRRRRAAIEAIGRAVETKLERAHAGAGAPSLDAARWIGAGRNHLARRSFAGLAAAERAFAAATAIDAASTDAWLGLATTRYALGTSLMRDPKEAFDAAEVALLRCEALAPERGDVRALRGEHLQFVAGDHGAARRVFEGVLEGDPANLGGLLGMMWLSLAGSDVRAARRYAAYAIVEEPASLDARTSFAIAALADGDAAGARPWLESVLNVEPAHVVARYYYAHALIAGGEYDECIAHVASVPTCERSTMLDVVASYASARNGDVAHARRRVGADAVAPGARSRYARAVAYAGLGEAVRALNELRRAVREREPFVATAAWDPLLAKVRAQPGFGALAEYLG
jgi:tetratricopeptide (TPR) repeat protein